MNDGKNRHSWFSTGKSKNCDRKRRRKVQKLFLKEPDINWRNIGVLERLNIAINGGYFPLPSQTAKENRASMLMAPAIDQKILFFAIPFSQIKINRGEPKQKNTRENEPENISPPDWIFTMSIDLFFWGWLEIKQSGFKRERGEVCSKGRIIEDVVWRRRRRNLLGTKNLKGYAWARLDQNFCFYPQFNKSRRAHSCSYILVVI